MNNGLKNWGRLFKLGLFWILLIGTFISNTSTATYDWPIEPFTSQHSVTGVLNECRSQSGVDRHHFHDGIDIGDADGGTPVYAVEAGWVDHTNDGEGLWVEGSSHTFFFYHLQDMAEDGSYVGLYDQLGEVVTGGTHLHFGEGPNGSEVNPLRAENQWDDGIWPFADSDDPVVDDIYLLENGTNTVVDPSSVSGQIDIVMKAHDLISDGGSNCGIYKVGYEIDNSGVINKYKFDNWLSSSCINWVYAEGSNTSTYKYIVTNNSCSDGYWDADAVDDDWYTIWVYAYDIKGNLDLWYLDVYVSHVGIEPDLDVTITSPQQGNVWYADETHDISWEIYHYGGATINRVELYYSINTEWPSEYITTINNPDPGTEWIDSYSWTPMNHIKRLPDKGSSLRM